MPTRIPTSHPRYRSLKTREGLKDAAAAGLVHATGLIAHGRGEAFDYLLGERTHAFAKRACRAAAAALLAAKHPVISLNGNVVALAAKDCHRLARVTGAQLEVNLFHRTEERVARLVASMKKAGSTHVLGQDPDARIPGLSSDRARCSSDGIFAADVVLVPLEDGDRAQALRRMRKRVLTIDLNPLSRTARTAHVTIVDELTRALPLLIQEAKVLRGRSPASLACIQAAWDNPKALALARAAMARA